MVMNDILFDGRLEVCFVLCVVVAVIIIIIIAEKRLFIVDDEEEADALTGGDLMAGEGRTMTINCFD
jgi:cell division protein FtsL